MEIKENIYYCQLHTDADYFLAVSVEKGRKKCTITLQHWQQYVEPFSSMLMCRSDGSWGKQLDIFLQSDNWATTDLCKLLVCI